MKFRFLALLALVLGLASCQKDTYGLDVDANGEAAVTISVALPEVETRAGGNDSAIGAFGNVDFSQYDVRYILEVYNLDGTLEGELAKERIVNTEDEAKETSFTLRLIPGRGYRFVVWADLVLEDTEDDLHYNTENLKDIQLATTEWGLSDETRDAYTGIYNEGTFSSTSNIRIELKRPLGKLRVVTTDIKDMFNVLPQDIKVVYSSQIYTSFDAHASNVIANSKQTINDEKSIKITESKYANEWNDGKVKENLTLFTDYYFAANEQEPISFTLDVKDNNGMAIPQVVFSTPIPIQRNYLTTVMGPVLTDANSITVVVNDAFANLPQDDPGKWNPEDDEYDVEVISGPYTETITLKTGNYFFKNVTVTTTTGPAIQIEENAVVTIDVQGILKLVGAEDGIAVPNSSKLTINGISETRAEGKFGNLNVVAKGGYGIGGIGADVTIKNTTIDYICGWPVQPLFEKDPSYGKSEPEGFSAIGGAKITLDNVEIKKAEGGSKAAAIGNRYWQSTEINITNSILGDVFGGNASAAIGGSRYSSDATKHSVKINIDGTTIKNAVGGQFAAGIGAGYDTHCSANDSNAVNNIVITNSNITVKGGKYGAGIGTGYHSAALTGSIDAASTINATAGESREKYTLAQNIGYGVVDATREFKGANVTFTVAGVVIPSPVTYNNIATVTTIEELQAALDAAKAGETLIHIAANIEGDITVTQKDGVHITIDGKENKYNGTITVNGQSSTVNDKSLTIKNVKFETEESNLAFIASTTDAVRYARNITIEDCTFKGSGDTSDVVALNLRQAYDIEVNNCKATDLHSFGQITSSNNMSFTKLIVTSGRGLNFQTAAHGTVVFNECNITATKYDGYGIRVARYAGNSLTVNNSTISAFEPVVLRGTATPFTLNLNKSTLTATGNGAENIVFTEPADIFIDGVEVVMINTAEKLVAAIENAKAGDTITIDGDITLTEALTLPAGIIFNGNGKQINGTLVAGGDLTFMGHTKVTDFSASYYNRTITIGKGACLEITGTGRASLAYGNTFDITGNVSDAKSTDKANVQPSLIIPGGISITGGNDAVLNIKDAYVQIGSTTSKNSAANGTFTINIENSIAEFTTQLTFSEPTNGNNPTFNLNVKNSVLTTGTKLILAATNCNMVVDNSTIDVKTYFRNSGNVELKNGSVLTGETIQFGENGGHDGTTTVDASKFTIKASSTGHAYDGKGTGSITLKNGAEVSVDYYKALTINSDANSTFTGTEVF